MANSLFHFVYQDNQAERTVVLFHGTGGDEHSLVQLARQLTSSGGQPTANLLGLRGNVQEQGMNRFFARHSLGVFDQASIRQETTKLSQFLTRWLADYNQEPENLVLMGYSNGANMIVALAFLFPELVNKAVLLHPMLPFEPGKLDLSHATFLVTAGEEDPMVPWAASQKLVATLQQSGAEVELVGLLGGHQVSREELERVAAFLT